MTQAEATEPTPFTSYAQNHEDVVLWRALGHVQNGTYVDVGAAHPVKDSVTKAFYLRGWNGVNVEPVKEFAEALDADRPRDTTFNCALGAEEGSVSFFEFPDTGLSTAVREEAESAQELGHQMRETVVPLRTLDSVLEQALPSAGEIHFLKVDVEGFEGQVFAGANLALWRPWVVVVESTRPNSTESSEETFSGYLTERGYHKVLFDGLNSFYLSSEHPELESALRYPACALDNFVAYNLISQENETAQTREKLDATYWQLKEATWRMLVNKAEVERLRPYEVKATQLAKSLKRAQQAERRLSRELDKKTPRGLARRVARRAVRASPTVVEKTLRKATGREAVTSARNSATTINIADQAPWIDCDALNAISAVVSDAERSEIDSALKRHRLEDDAALTQRLDGANDLQGRTLAECFAFSSLINQADWRSGSSRPSGSLALIDVRCLQDPAYATRGIGRYAIEAVSAASEALPRGSVLLLASPELPELEGDVARLGSVIFTPPRNLHEVGLFIQPAPMTASIGPLLPILKSDCHKLAVIHDFIPANAPQRYLSNPAERAAYRSRLVALSYFSEYVCNSHQTAAELKDFGLPARPTTVAWTDAVSNAVSGTAHQPNIAGPLRVFVPSGGDTRKNLENALAACGQFIRVHGEKLEVIVLGHSHEPAKVMRLARDAGLPPESLLVLPLISDSELDYLLSTANVALVMSRSEGLSLPVIEALHHGTPVIASDIAVHQELIGRDHRYLPDPMDPMAASEAIQYVLSNGERVLREQLSVLSNHEHETFGKLLADRVAEVTSGTSPSPYLGGSYVNLGARPSIGVATPWAPQASGISDYSAWTLPEIAKLCDLTVYAAKPAVSANGELQEFGASTDLVGSHDAFLSVLGNSHFHVPIIRLLMESGGAALAHDTRMVNFYLHLRGKEGLVDVMQRNPHVSITPADIADQIANLDSLADSCYGEIARAANPLIFHSRLATERVARETGTEPRRIPFVPYRLPHDTQVSARLASRRRLGLRPDAKHVMTFGIVDPRTKNSDALVEATAWLRQWGDDVDMHFVGPVSENLRRSLMSQAEDAGVTRNVHFTNRVSAETYADYLLAGDLSVQLRMSSILGISGAIVDSAAFGMPALASEPLVSDMDLPEYVERIPVVISPLQLAEGIEQRLFAPKSPAELESLRLTYVNTYTRELYARELLKAMGIDV